MQMALCHIGKIFDSTRWRNAIFDNINDLRASFPKSSKYLLIWFHNNLIKSTPEKWHLPIYEKLSGNHFDNRLTLDYHISELCKIKLVRILMH